MVSKGSKTLLDEIAVAVKYNFGAKGEAPKVVASGRGLLARKIIEAAMKSKVPIKESRDLAESLAKVPVGVEIPAELWEAMAEVLAHIFMLDGSISHGK